MTYKNLHSEYAHTPKDKELGDAYRISIHNAQLSDVHKNENEIRHV